MLSRVLRYAVVLLTVLATVSALSSAWDHHWIKLREITLLVLLAAAVVLLSAPRRLPQGLRHIALPLLIIVIVATMGGLLYVRASIAIGRYGSSDYEGLHRSASAFVETLQHKTLVYRKEGLHRIVLLTDKPFLAAIAASDLVDGTSVGVPSNLTPAQIDALAGYVKYPFWYGGYYTELYKQPYDTSTRYYFVLPPGPFRNHVLVLSESVYRRMN